MLVVLAGVSLFVWPIVAEDADLWFHLDYGRFMWTTHAIPTSTYFSFITPSLTPGAHHAWLFQGLVYWWYARWGYVGLLAFRALATVATWVVIWRWLFAGRVSFRSTAWATVVFLGCLHVIFPREVLIRPHLIDYFVLPTFLLILERRPRGVVLLPPLALLWCNLHGAVATPAVLLIGLSYSAEELFRRRDATTTPRPSRLVWLVGMMLASLVSPFGWQLLHGLPSFDLASWYVQEHQRLRWTDLLDVHISHGVPSHQTMFGLLFFLSGWSLIAGLAKRRLRLSHAGLWVGAVVCAARSLHFLNEFALLVLPLLVEGPLLAESPTTDGARVNSRRLTATIALLAVSVASVAAYAAPVATHPAYPLSRAFLPEGVAAFLNTVDASGAVLNHPDTGGYLRWRLYPKYRIFMDMEFPRVPDDVLYLAMHMYVDPPVLRKVLTRYEPSFLTVPLKFNRFPELIRTFPDYVPVFFDDVEVLYVNRRHYPHLAEAYALNDVNPFHVEASIDAVAADDGAPLFAHLPALLAIDPGCATTNRVMALRYLRDGSPDRTLPFAEAIIRNYPERAAGYDLNGRALQALGSFEAALRQYRMALQRVNDDETRRDIWKAIGLIRLAQGHYPQAYRALANGVRIFSPGASTEELYALGHAARLAGKTREARAILIFLKDQRLSPGETTWASRIGQELQQLR